MKLAYFIMCVPHVENVISNLKVLPIKQILARTNLPHNFVVDACLVSHSFQESKHLNLMSLVGLIVACLLCTSMRVSYPILFPASALL